MPAQNEGCKERAHLPIRERPDAAAPLELAKHELGKIPWRTGLEHHHREDISPDELMENVDLATAQQGALDLMVGVGSPGGEA